MLYPYTNNDVDEFILVDVVENIVDEMIRNSNYVDCVKHTMLHFVTNPKQAFNSCKNSTKEMINTHKRG